jgi:hypothetical protein
MQNRIKEESSSSDAISEPVTLARQLVSTTAEQLGIAKAQYKKARSTHDAAVALCGVLGGPEPQLKSQTAVGDHWAVLGKNGHPLQNTTGKHPTFETTNIFFRLNPTESSLLRRQEDEAEFGSIHQWPKIRDTDQPNNWRFDMISALLIIRNEDHTATRLASVLLDREHWMGQEPTLTTITLV